MIFTFSPISTKIFTCKRKIMSQVNWTFGDKRLTFFTWLLTCRNKIVMSCVKWTFSRVNWISTCWNNHSPSLSSLTPCLLPVVQERHKMQRHTHNTIICSLRDGRVFDGGTKLISVGSAEPLTRLMRPYWCRLNMLYASITNRQGKVLKSNDKVTNFAMRSYFFFQLSRSHMWIRVTGHELPKLSPWVPFCPSVFAYRRRHILKSTSSNWRPAHGRADESRRNHSLEMHCKYRVTRILSAGFSCVPASALEITKRKRTAQESIAKCHFLRCCMIYSVQPGVIKNECWSFQTPILKHQSIN